MRLKIFLSILVFVTLAATALYLLPSARALAPQETFPSASSFARGLGTEIETDLSDIAFLNIIDSTNSRRADILAINSIGKGAIVSKSGESYRTYQGLDFASVPNAQIISDVTGDDLPDIISLLPAKKIPSKEWHYGKITQVGADYFSIDVPLRKNILTSSTIIAPNGKQYVVSKNNNPDDDSPRNAIYLETEIGNTSAIPPYTTFLQINQFIAFLVPLTVPTEEPSLMVHINQNNNNFTPTECRMYIPRDIQHITSLATLDVNNDGKKDLALLAHPRELLHTTSVRSSYNADSKVLTFTMVPAINEIGRRDLRGSYFSLTKNPDQLFKIESNTDNQIVVNIQLPPSGDGLDTLKNSFQSGDNFWLTLNDEASRENLVYFGDNTGCFTYTGEIQGIVYEGNFGRALLPNANTLPDSNRTIITDTTLSLLPINSFANRRLRIESDSYTIEYNDQGHIYLATQHGDITAQLPSVAAGNVATTYTIEALTPQPSVNLDRADQITNTFRDIPNEITSMINTIPLATTNPWIRPVDIDQDTDIDLLFIHQNHIFLKLNNERSR